MAMLQLGGTLSFTTVRITPRISLRVTTQHLLNASSVAPSPDVEKQALETTFKNNTRYVNKKSTVQGSLISAAFKVLNKRYVPISNKQFNKEHVSVNSKIQLATTVDELLNTVHNPRFEQHNASTLIHILCNWITTGKVAMHDIQDDPRYLKVCQILDIEKESSNLSQVTLDNENFKSTSYHILQTESVNRQIEDLNTSQMISVLVELANRHKRVTPTLKLLAHNIANSDDILNIKQLSDILYSMASLTFYDEVLVEKTCKSLLKLVPKTDSAAVIGSLLTSLGLLRYRDDTLLDLLSSWIVENKSIIRPNEISGLLMTLANLGYTPNNFNQVFESIVMPLQESDMCQSSEWLDIVWALTILNKANSHHYESVLNDGFQNRIFDTKDALVGRIIKLLNINASAQFQKDYKGPLIPEKSSLFDTIITKSKDKIELSNAIIGALKILLPSDKIYLNTNTPTDMGLLLDAEFCVDSNCTPVPLDSKSEKDKKVFRIAIIACSYHDFCQNQKETIGPIKFYEKLLNLKGYKVLLISYLDINKKDKLVVRVKCIKDNLTKILQNVPT